MSDKNHRHTAPPFNNPTFSSTLLNQIYLSIDRESYPAEASKLNRPLDDDRKISTPRRARLVDKWMDKPREKFPFQPPIDPPPRKRPSPPPPPPPPVAPADDDPDSFFSTTSVSSSDSSIGGFSSTASEAETPSFNGSSKPRTSCFGPLRAPKPVRTTIAKKKPLNSEDSEEDCSTNKSSSSSKAAKIYSQLKNLKQPISPGLKLAKYINSLFVKEHTTTRKKKSNKNSPRSEYDPFDGKHSKSRGVPAPARKYKSEQTSPEPSFSGCSLNKPSASTLPPHNTVKRTVKFAGEDDRLPSAIKTASESSDKKKGSLLMKRYEELKRLNISKTEECEEIDTNRKVLEEVAMDLLSSYWNRRKSEANGENDEKDDSSCSSSDLFELDHLSLIGNAELPVYETTRLN